MKQLTDPEPTWKVPMKPEHEHQYIVVVEWGIQGPINGYQDRKEIATKVMCPCGETKEI